MLTHGFNFIVIRFRREALLQYINRSARLSKSSIVSPERARVAPHETVTLSMAEPMVILDCSTRIRNLLAIAKSCSSLTFTTIAINSSPPHRPITSKDLVLPERVFGPLVPVGDPPLPVYEIDSVIEVVQEVPVKIAVRLPFPNMRERHQQPANRIGCRHILRAPP